MDNQVLQTVKHGKTTFTAQLTTFGGRSDATPVLQLQSGDRGKYRSIYRDELEAIIANVQQFADMLDAMDTAMAQQTSPPVTTAPQLPAGLPPEVQAMLLQFLSAQTAPEEVAESKPAKATKAKSKAAKPAGMNARVNARLRSEAKR